MKKLTLKNIINQDVRNNYLSLTFLQVSNYVFPLITLPYLVRTLGANSYGIIAFATATIAYFQILTDFGFNLTATRKISIHKKEIRIISRVYNTVMNLKFYLITLSGLILLILTNTFEIFKSNQIVLFYTFCSVITQALIPVWLFQGIQKMYYLTISNFISRLLFTISVFLLIHKTQDYVLVPLLNSLSILLAGLFCTYIVFVKLKIEIIKIPLKELKSELKNNFDIFLSNLSISFYTIFTTILLGIFASNKEVAYFDGANKIIRILKNLYNPFAQAIFPYLSEKFETGKKIGLKIASKMLIYSSIIMLIICATIFLMADIIILTLFGAEFEKSVTILRVLALTPFFITISNNLGIQTMINLGYEKEFRNILFKGALFSGILSFVLIPLYQSIGSAVVIFLTELLIATLMIYFKKKNINNELKKT